MGDGTWEPTPIPHPPSPIIDWGEAIAAPTLYGRADELQTLQHWVVEDRCRVVAIVGIGGMGKSSLAITFAQRVVPQFEFVVFRSLQNGPPLAEVLDQTIRTVSDQRTTPPDQISGKIALLIQLLRERRCLLILDNLEAILEPGALTGTYRSGYAEYGSLLRALSERVHQSCLLLTSREKPSELGPLEGRSAPVRSLQLAGLADNACRLILEAGEDCLSRTRRRSEPTRRAIGARLRHKENRAYLEAPDRRGLLSIRLCLAMSQRFAWKISAEAIAI